MIVDKTIQSASNPLVKEWAELSSSKGIRKQGLFIVAGERAVRETLSRFPQLARSLFVCVDRHATLLASAGGGSRTSVGTRDSREGPSSRTSADSERAWLQTSSTSPLESLVDAARALSSRPGGNSPKTPAPGIATPPDSHVATAAPAPRTSTSRDASTERFTVIALARAIFDQLDVSGTHEPLLLTRTPEIADLDLTKDPEGLELICAMGDPSNVGALLRSAAAFGASKVILLKESASPFHPKAVRAASAATLLTPLSRGPSIQDLPAMAESGACKGPLLALDMQGTKLDSFTWPKNARLLIGEEGPGVPSSKAFTYLSIPMANDVESLNATVAASVAMYAYKSRR